MVPRANRKIPDRIPTVFRQIPDYFLTKNQTPRSAGAFEVEAMRGGVAYSKWNAPSGPGVKTPFSVMMPVMSSCGVTSKAGLNTPMPSGVLRIQAL